MKTLEEVQKYLNSIPKINYGGCGISALAMYRWLQKHNQAENTKFVFLYDDRADYLNNSKVLRNKEGKPVAPKHAVLFHNGHFIDSRGNVNIEEDTWVQIIGEEKFIEKAINKASWNSMFSREHILDIERSLEIDLSDIKR